MAAETTAEGTLPDLRSKGDGVVCPRCRYRQTEPSSPRGTERCPRDGAAMVSSDALARADGDPFLGAIVDGRFAILERLGSGSMGTVYRARQEAMGRFVAIKILRSERAYDVQAKARFKREARAMSLLTSPHTVTVFDFGEIPPECSPDGLSDEAASLYLAMELLQGESLGDRLRRGGRLSAIEAVRVARHALLSLAEAHDKGIVHRDLKPDNLFLVPAANGEGVTCKVLDFGIAKVVSDAAFDASADVVETQAGTVFGTPRYMSPEQAQGKPLDGRSDLYSLGVLLYHMLVGQAPFIDDDAVVVMAQHIKSTPTSPELRAPEAGISAELAHLVMRALAKDPADRPSSARAFMRELDHAMAVAARPVDSAAETEELGVLVREGRARLLRSPTTVAATLLIVSLVGAGLMVRTFRARAPAPARIGVAAALAELTPLIQRDGVVEASSVAAVPEPEPATSAVTSASVGAPTVPAVRSRPRGKQPPSSKKYTRFE